MDESHLKAYYQMRKFDWERYLNSFSFLPREQNSPLSSPDDFEIICEVAEDKKNFVPYKSNTKSILKDAALTFKNVLLKTLRHIEWKVINRGKEASAVDSKMTFFMDEYRDKNFCLQGSAYNGHHYMECTLYDFEGKVLGKDSFGIYA